jgi:hypothetical protein
LSIKNDNFDFYYGAPSDVKGSFVGIPQKILLPAGTQIFRFTTLGQNATDSGFWITADVYQCMSRWSAQSGTPLSELARARLAVKMNWSLRMDMVCRATLKQSSYAFEGAAQYQIRSEEDKEKKLIAMPNVLLMGKFKQLWIPGMSVNDIWIDSYGPADNWKRA